MQIEFAPFKLIFKKPFRIAHGTRSFTDVVYVRFSFGGYSGYGEASLPPYLPETADSVSDFLRKLSLTSADLTEGLERIEKTAAGNMAAKAACSMALIDLAGKLSSQPAYKILGTEPGENFSSVTVTGPADEKMLEKELGEINAPYIKVKLGGGDDEELVGMIRKHCSLPGWADVNQGWSDTGYAREMTFMLKEEGFLFVEQPFPVAMKKETEWLSSENILPVIADEACQTISDLDETMLSYSGINIKLMKCGGVRNAIEMAAHARKNNLMILLGGMAESSCAAAAALQIASVADYLDLDGPQLISNDPFEGYDWNNGKPSLSHEAGNGISLKEQVSWIST